MPTTTARPPRAPAAPSRARRLDARLTQHGVRLAARLLARHRPVPDWAAAPRRVLYMRHDTLGDMLIATGVVRAIATSHPSITVDVVGSERNAAVLAGNPHVGAFIPYEQRRRGASAALARRIRDGRYDAVIDATVGKPSLTTMLVVAAAPSPLRIGVAGRANEPFFDVALPPARADAPLAEQWGVTAIPFGVNPARADLRPEIFLTDAERAAAATLWAGVPGTGGRMLVNIASNDARRRWPLDRFVETLRTVRAERPEARIAVMGAPPDAADVADVARETGAAALTPGLREAMALVERSDLLLTPDTSHSHVASAFRTPTVVMQQAGLTMYSPYRTPGASVFSPDQSLQSLAVEPVVRALRPLLERLAATEAAR